MLSHDFLPKPTPRSVRQIAEILELPFPKGADPDLLISDVGTLEDACAGQASFLDNPAYLPLLEKTHASLIFCKERYLAKVPKSAVAWQAPAPYQAYAKLAAALYPDGVRPCPLLDQHMEHKGKVASSATVHKAAQLEENVTVEAGAHIGAYAEIGCGTVIAAGAVIGRHVKIGRDCFIGANVVLQHCYVGDGVFIHSNAAIGQDGFGYAMAPSGHQKIPQIGRVIIQNDVEIGANTTIDRGANRDTVIGEGTKIDNHVQIGHNAVIGRHCILVAQVAIAGSAVLEDLVVIGGKTAVIGHITVGEGAHIASMSAVRDHVPKAARWGGVPAKPVREWFKEVTLLSQLAKKANNKKEIE